MTKVITYGTYDLIHFGHIRLLERARALGDYLIVGVTSDDFDKSRGKINVQQSLIERINAIKALGIADEIIVEEYEGQKIDDIKRYDIDIFTVGSDWAGTFDYLNDYCRVVYLDRTEGVSSSGLRSEKSKVTIGIAGSPKHFEKFINECSFVNGAEVTAFFTDGDYTPAGDARVEHTDYGAFLGRCDAVYIITHPTLHYTQIKQALLAGKHVICESPLALKASECSELFGLAREKGLVLMEAIKTAYSTAYYRLLLLIKTGCIGDVISVDATCTSLQNIDFSDPELLSKTWSSICSWGPTAMLPVLQILGTDFRSFYITSKTSPVDKKFDVFSKIEFIYDNAVSSVKVGKGVKSEGELIITGTKGYILVPAPWWKTDYFEVRFENSGDNKKYFYALEGEGIRYQIISFVKSITGRKVQSYIDENTSLAISSLIESFENGENIRYI